MSNPEFTFWIDGPCAETVLGAPGSLWDDGTGGHPYFERELPGQTLDVILRIVPIAGPGSGVVDDWEVSVGVERPLYVVGATLNGTAGCSTWPAPRFAECRRDGTGEGFVEITGPPDGTGPQTEDNIGVISRVMPGADGNFLPPEGNEKILKLRVVARYPQSPGEIVLARVFFGFRIGSGGVSDLCVDGTFGIGDVCYPDWGNPPLTVVDCQFFLMAAATAAFRRCDPNDDGRLNMADAVWIFMELFRGGRATRCPAAADCDGDGERSLSDGIYGLRYLFTGSPPPPSPFPDCGFLDLPEEACPPGSTTCS